ncbi:LytR family transcriptional regulator, partial [Streptomyces spiralis]
MNDWPEGWSGDERGPRYGRGSAGAQPEGARVMRQVRRGGPAVPPGQGAYGGQRPAAPPHGVPQQPSYVDGGYADGYTDSDDGYGYDSGYNTGQVYGRPGGDGPGGPGEGR